MEERIFTKRKRLKRVTQLGFASTHLLSEPRQSAFDLPGIQRLGRFGLDPPSVAAHENTRNVTGARCVARRRNQEPAGLDFFRELFAGTR